MYISQYILSNQLFKPVVLVFPFHLSLYLVLVLTVDVMCMIIVTLQTDSGFSGSGMRLWYQDQSYCFVVLVYVPTEFMYS